ncbi:MAG: protease pro-enzyme activation domain-containing protein [Marmoricola sp.]
MSRRFRTALAVVVTAALGTALSGLNAPAQASNKHALGNSVPSWAKSASKKAASKGSDKVDFRVYLDWRGGTAAADYARAVTTPGNKQYGKFLTADQFAAKYAPSATTVANVKSWLKTNGFTVGTVPSNNKYVEAVGTVAQAAKAFSTSFSSYSVQGQLLRSNNSPLVVPNSLTGVTGVIGLDDSAALVHRNSNPPGVFLNGTPCSRYWGEKTVANSPTPDGTVLPSSPSAFAPCGYAGAQLQGAYGMRNAITTGNNGAGVTVGIIDAYASPTMLADGNAYSAAHGLPPLTGLYSEHVAPGTKVRGENKKQDPEGWSGEQTLDVEAVHTMAPGAKILYVGSPNNFQDMDASMNWIVSRHAANIVTNSYGFSGEAIPRGWIKPINDVFIQAAATGISLFFSSGDCADESVDSASCPAGPVATPDWPASSPWVTAVGGTSMGIGADNNRIFELGWETAKSTLGTAGAWNPAAWLYGSGGGTSRLFTQPSYQSGVVPPSISQRYGGAAMRSVPDVAALGDPTTGMAVGQTQTWPDGHTGYAEYRIGGTSLASPLYAGMFALAMQKAGHEFGLANPVLYSAAANDITKAQLGAYPGAVRSDFVNGVDGSDGYVYSARYFDTDGSLTIHVANGYDDVTGVGSPQGQNWLNAIAASH